MRAITLAQGKYGCGDAPAPAPAQGQVLIKVTYAGVNRADLLQKQGHYPGPGGTPAIPGMEVSGEIAALSPGVNGFKKGDRVCALVSEGAFAEMVAVNAAHVLPVPKSVSMEEAAALPEACFTVWISLVWQARLAPGETVLIHGGASGIGTIAIQMAKLLGASQVLATAGTPQKCALIGRIGAKAIPYREQDFVAVVKDVTGGKGVDVILDMVGGDYFQRNLESLAHGGRLAIIAFLKGAKMEANLGPILLKHLHVMGSTLRARPAQEKAKLAAELRPGVWKAVEKRVLKPVIDQVFPLKDAEKALERMDQGLNIGKILLKL